MLRTIELGPVVIQTSLFLFIIGLAVAIEVTTRISDRNNSQSMQNLLWIGFIAFLLGSRLSYIILNWSVYHHDLGAWLSPRPQALDGMSGAFIALATVVVYLRQRYLPVRSYLDLLSPGLAVMAIFINLGFLATGDYFGQTTSVPWAIELWGADRHPTQLYALLGSLITLALLLWQHRQSGFAGRDFLIVVAGNAFTWLLVGLLLANPTLIFEQYRQLQVLMWGVLVATAFLWHLWHDTYAFD